MTWPSPGEFRSAVQTPNFCFEHLDLRLGDVRTTLSGIPANWAGNFACVFQVSRSTSRKFAVRCFTREVGDQRDRYGQLAGFLKDNKPESFVGFEYLDRGIRVKGAWYPIVKMDWVEGDTLDKFVETRLNENKPNEIQDMAAKWLQTTMDLRRRHIVHNDLQHGNIMVQGGNFRLVDYDGVILPKLPKKSSSEVGHANYQHPQRSDQHYGDYVDNFPALVLYLSLLAISADPGLWASFNTGQNLILTKQDYRNPKDSKCFKALKQSPDTAVASLAAYLEECCHKPVDQVPNLESILQRLNTPLGRPSPSPSEFRELLRTSQATAPPVPNQRKSPAPQVPVSRQTRLPVKPPTHPTAQPTYVGPTGTDAVGYFNDGTFLQKQAKYDLAIERFNSALDLDPNYVDALYHRGRAYQSKQLYDRAIKDYSTAIGINGDYGDCWFYRGWAYFNLRKYDLAIRDFDQAIRVVPNHAEAIAYRSLAGLRMDTISNANRRNSLAAPGPAARPSFHLARPSAPPSGEQISPGSINEISTRRRAQQTATLVPALVKAHKKAAILLLLAAVGLIGLILLSVVSLNPEPHQKLPNYEVYVLNHNFIPTQSPQVPDNLLAANYTLWPPPMAVVSRDSNYLIWTVAFDVSREAEDFDIEGYARWLDVTNPNRPLLMLESPWRLRGDLENGEQAIIPRSDVVPPEGDTGEPKRFVYSSAGLGREEPGLWQPGFYQVQFLDNRHEVLVDWNFEVR